MDLTSPLINIGFGLALFSSAYIFGLKLQSARASLNSHLPNITMPEDIRKAYPVVNTGHLTFDSKKYVSNVQFANPLTPWRTRRADIVCTQANCTQAGPGYVFNLRPTSLMPSQGYPNEAGTLGQAGQAQTLGVADIKNLWIPEVNAWHLSTFDMRTGYDTTYPVATVIVVPENTPEFVKYIMDITPVTDPLGLGVRSLVTYNGPLNMSVTGVPGGLNITGDWAHSFVIVNDANHSMFMPQEAILSDSVFVSLQYWIFKPGSWTLMWPASRYFDGSPVPQSRRIWNATPLPENMHSFEVAANAAEIIMFALANKFPFPDSP